MQRKKITIIFIVIIIIAITTFFLLYPKYKMRNLTQNGNYRYHVLDGNYTIEINLNNLESNKGKILFDNKGSKIIIMDIEYDENNGYRIFFQCNSVLTKEGIYLNSLMCWNDSNEQDYKQVSELTVHYNGNIYSSNHQGHRGDGTEIGYYLFDTNDDAKEAAAKKGTANIEIDNIYENNWY